MDAGPLTRLGIQVTCPSGNKPQKRAGSGQAPEQRDTVMDRDDPGMDLVKMYISILRHKSTSDFPSFAAGNMAGCKKRKSESPRPFQRDHQTCTAEQPDLHFLPARQDSGGSVPQNKRQTCCQPDDQEDVAESMPWGSAEACAVPDRARQPSCSVKGRDHSSQSAASSHWQYQVWPQPTFKLHRDVVEDDATSPLSASCSEQD